MKILVLCTGNSCRSQMAHGFFREYLPEAVVRSAGTSPHDLNPLAVKVMAERNIDISNHTPEHVDRYTGETFDYVVTVCDNAAQNCPVFPGEAVRLHWPFDDPAAFTGPDDSVLEVFRRVRDEIDRKIREWLATLPSD